MSNFFRIRLGVWLLVSVKHVVLLNGFRYWLAFASFLFSFCLFFLFQVGSVILLVLCGHLISVLMNFMLIYLSLK